MKQYLPFFFASLFLMAGSVHAQSVALRADVPFDFVVGDTIMHAGIYKIQPMHSGKSSVLLQSLDGKESMILAACTCASNQTEHESKLVFQISNGQYFLWQIWAQGYDEGRQLAIKHSETQEAKLTPSHTVVILAASGRL